MKNNIRNSISKVKRGSNKTNFQILNEFVTSKKLRLALTNLNDVELVELSMRLEEMNKKY